MLPGPLDRRIRVLSGPGLVLYVLTLTFMSVDWVMSLDPHWYSTIFGILTLGGQGLSTMAFTDPGAVVARRSSGRCRTWRAATCSTTSAS